jgi:ATP-dependent Clp protease protease subunit
LDPAFDPILDASFGPIFDAPLAANLPKSLAILLLAHKKTRLWSLKMATEEESTYVKVQGNEVFFHCDVHEESVLELVTKMRALVKNLRKTYIDLGIEEDPAVTLYVKSDGGDLHSGFSAMDHIRNLRARVTTVADGLCASAATLLLLAGQNRKMMGNSYVLIHQISADGVWGKYEELKDHMQNFTKDMERMQQVYEAETEIPLRKLKKILKKDLYLDSEQCLRYGLVHEVIKPPSWVQEPELE